MPGILNLRDYGAIFNDSSASALANNYAAVQSGLNAIATGVWVSSNFFKGGGLTWDEDLYINFPINYIVLPYQSAGGTLYPVMLGIVGNGVNTRLINTNHNNYAIVISGISPAGYTPAHISNKLEGIEIRSAGGGVNAQGGGKNIFIRNLILNQCSTTGLNYFGHDGAGFENIIALNNDIGINIEQSHHVDAHYMRADKNRVGIMFGALLNGETGHDAVTYTGNCAAWIGFIHADNNRFFGLNNTSEWKYNVLSLSTSGNGPSNLPYGHIQNRLQRTHTNELYGKFGADEKMAVIADGLSWQARQYMTATEKMPNIGTQITAAASGSVLFTGPGGTPSVASFIGINSTNIWARFNATATTFGNGYGLGKTDAYFSYNASPLSTTTYNADDYFLIRAIVSGSRETEDYYFSKIASGNIIPCLTWSVSQNNGDLLISQPWNMSQRGMQTVDILCKTNSVGTGITIDANFHRPPLDSSEANLLFNIINVSVNKISNTSYA